MTIGKMFRFFLFFFVFFVALRYFGRPAHFALHFQLPSFPSLDRLYLFLPLFSHTLTGRSLAASSDFCRFARSMLLLARLDTEEVKAKSKKYRRRGGLLENQASEASNLANLANLATTLSVDSPQSM